ncbi:ethanolamine kinase-like isoform X2 [Aphidius gifuensis]|nr:ethanolamine kinase-like isoform X2 [Aphidius gifuensis]
MVLVRVYGHKTDMLIDRKAETRNIRILHKAGYTHSLYATFNNGLAYEFLEGDVLTSATVREPEIYNLVAKRMAQMHKLEPNDSDIIKEPMLWKKTEQFMDLMPREFDDPVKQKRFERMIKPHDTLKNEYKKMKDKLIQLNSPVVFSHNDLLLANILYNKKQNTVTFIDFEYTAFNYQAFDIANHFAEFPGVDDIDYSLYPDESLQRSWLRKYLQSYNESSSVSEDEVTKLYKHIEKFVLMSHFLWGCWSLIQYKHSSIDFDFLKFAAVRFDECFNRRKILDD